MQQKFRWFNGSDFAIYGLIWSGSFRVIDGIGNYLVKHTPVNELIAYLITGIALIITGFIFALFSGKFKNSK